MMRNKTFLLGLLCLLLGSATAFAQVQVSGVVVDAKTAEPVIGANIIEVGTTNGTITDFDGNFALTVKQGAQLEISYMGYKSQTLPATANMRVALGEDSELLDEVIVVGYGVVKKNDATGSVTAIKPDDMNKGLTTNAQEMLQGKIAGVTVTSSDGTPGGAGTIRVRGGSSLSASNSPLIVIDGLAMDNNGIQGVANPLSMVNPSDIESFTVLKDASATAIYGSRASNGVIIITTKKGAKGSKPKFNYEGNVSFGTMTNRLETLTGDEVRAYAEALGHKNSKTKWLGTANTDWQDQIYRTAISTDHNFSVNGGTKNMPYRFSLGYTDQNGIIKTSNMQRVTAALALSPSFLDNHLNFNVNAKGMYIYNRYADGGVVGSAISMDPTAPVYGQMVGLDGKPVGATTEQIDKVFGGFYQRSKNGNYNDPEWMVAKNAQTTANPLATLMQKNDRAHAGSFIGNIEADYQIHGFEDLRIHANFGADYSYGKQTTSIDRQSYSNHYFGWEGFSEKSKYNLQFSAYLQYYKDFSETQHFDIMVGYENQYFYSNFNQDGAGSYPETNNDESLRGTAKDRYQKTSITDNALQSVYGRVNWNGWNQLLITATLRADASSRFAKKNSRGENARWGLFPSVALGWKIKETFLRDVNEINDFKLRLGYGITGQQDIGYDYYYLPTYTVSEIGAYYPIGGENIALNSDGEPIAIGDLNMYYNYRPGAYNPDLTWEKTTTYNAGIDMAFMNNRINLTLDYYYRNTVDLINWVNAPAGTNFKNRIVSNVGSLRNQGVEFALDAVVFDRKNFKWDLAFNATWNDNMITELYGSKENPDYNIEAGGISAGTGNTIAYHHAGNAASTFWVYETRQIADEDGKKSWYIIDRNHDGQINASDRYYYKSPDAKVTLGLQSKWQFYGFDLGITLRAHLGNYVYNDVLSDKLRTVASGEVYSAQNGGYNGILRAAFDEYWKGGIQSDNLKTLLYNEDGTVAGTGTSGEWYFCDRFVENASFLRIDNITLGYTFNKPTIQARLFATVSNPAVFSKYSGLDPEVFGGIDNNLYPRCMTTVIGVSLHF